MDEVEISIVVPVYNVERYLEKCILSILNQSYKNFQLILINDGSTDNSLDICKKIEKTDKRVLVINSENKGVSSARNIGLNNAVGRYIMFVDSDDILADNSLKKMHDVIEIGSYDLVIGNYSIFEDDFDLKNEIYNKKVDLSCDVFSDFIIINNLWEPWGKLVKRELIIEMFDTNVHILEDCLFWLKNINIKSFKYIDECVYHYRNNNKSLTRFYEVNSRVLSEFDAIDKILDLPFLDIKKKEYFYIFFINRVFVIKRKYVDKNNYLKSKLFKNKINKYFRFIMKSANIDVFTKMKIIVKKAFITYGYLILR